MATGDSTDDLLAQADRHWLAVGLRLGLEQPAEARRLLARIERPWETAGAAAVAASGSSEVPAEPERDATEDVDGDAGTRSIPAASMLLVRSATMPADQQAELGPEVVWGWAARLTPAEITLVGRVVQQMLDGGAPANVGRGFGIAWTDGVKLPASALDLMFKEFVELEQAVASVIAGRDLRLETSTRGKSVGDMLSGWFGRSDSGNAATGRVIEGAGRPAQLGLVALWNTWVGVRYRSSIPQPTFELLVKPWVTVVGPLPDA
jgi:hypothetical protein